MDAGISWEGSSLDVMSSFPSAVKKRLGFQLRLLQQGAEPTDYRAMATVGRGVYELRDEDESGWYRVIYLSRIRGFIYVLHCFKKQSRKTPRHDIAVAKRRLSTVRERLAAAKRGRN